MHGLEHAISTPVKVAGLPGPFTRLVGGMDHFCAVAGGDVHCWGFGNLAAQTPIGEGAANPQLAPLKVTGISGRVEDLSAGLDFNCAVTSDGVQCWGQNDVGQLGGSDMRAHKSAKPSFVLKEPAPAE